MNCAQALERRWRRLDGELNEEEAAQLDEHERSCAACREHAAKAERLHGLLRKSYQEKPLAAPGTQAEQERRAGGLWAGSSGAGPRAGASLPWTQVLSEMLTTTSGQAALGALALSLGVLVYFGPDILSAFSNDKASGSLWALRRTAAESSEGRPASPDPTGSLDYARDANQGALSPTGTETEAGKDAAGGGTEGKGEDAAKEPDKKEEGSGGPDHSGSSFSRPSLVPSQALRSAGSSSGSSASAGVPGGQVSGGAGRTKALAFARPQAARGTSIGRSGAGSRKALSQLKAAEKISRSGVGLGPESGRATEARAFEGGGKGAVGNNGLGLSGGGLGNSLGDVPPNPNPDIKNNEIKPGSTEVEGTEVTPYDWMISLARMALLLADLLLALAAILSWNKALSATSILLIKAANALALLSVGMGLAVMMMYGQIQQGMILMLAGGVAAGAGLLALNGVPAASLILLIGAAGSSIISGITMNLANKL